MKHSKNPSNQDEQPERFAGEQDKTHQQLESEEDCRQEDPRTVQEEDAEKNDADLKALLEAKIASLEEKCTLHLQGMQRVAADFENYKKRVERERETTYVDAQNEVIQSLLPVLDTFSRALQVQQGTEDVAFVKGVQMIYKQFQELFQKWNVEPIAGLKQSFNPELHNAVMHIEDEAYGANEIVEELQTGYMRKGKVLRHSMVKVAN